MKKLVFVFCILFAVSCSSDKDEIITDGETNLSTRADDVIYFDGPIYDWSSLRLPIIDETTWCGTCIKKAGTCGSGFVLNIFNSADAHINVHLTYDKGNLNFGYADEDVTLKDIERQIKESHCNINANDVYNLIRTQIEFETPLYLDQQSTAHLVPNSNGKMLMIRPGVYNLSYHPNYPHGATRFQTQLVDPSEVAH